MDSLVNMGLGGAALALLWWFLKAVLIAVQPVVAKHIETMDSFQENQAAIAASLSARRSSDEEHRAQVQAEHREILNGLERIESR